MHQLRKSRRPYTWMLTVILALALLVGLAFYRPFQGAAGLDFKAPPINEPAPAPPPALPTKRTTFLVMGVDVRPEEGGRSDTLIVASFDPATQQISLLSLPRDTWVKIPGYGFDKINHAYAFGQESLMKQTVESLLAIPIDHFVTISFDSFQEIVDALGGVEIDAEKRMYYEDPDDTGMGPDGLVIDIQPGVQVMDGETALEYSRFRSDDEGDIGRMRRQQQVIKAVVRKVASPAVIVRLPQLLPALSKSIYTDLSVAQLIGFAAAGKDSLGQGIKTGTLQGEPDMVDGFFYMVPDLVHDRKAAYEVLIGGQPTDEYLARAVEDQATYARALADAKADDVAVAADEPEPDSSAPPSVETAPEPTDPQTAPQTTPDPPKPPTTQPVTIRVVDATGNGLGQEYAAKLKAAGFRVSRVGTAKKPVIRTVAIDRAGQPANRERLEALFPTILWVTQPDPQAGEPIELVLGQDLVKP